MFGSNRNSQSNNLIVDFPSNPRQRDGTQATFKLVRFAEHRDEYIIDYPSSEIGKRWYSNQDEMSFQRKVWRDAVNCSRMLMGIQEGLVDMDRTVKKKFLVHCVGLEHLLSRTSVSAQNDSNRRAKKVHASVVLQEYKKQKESGVFSTVILARVSDTSSESARKRAHSRACMVEILSD